MSHSAPRRATRRDAGGAPRLTRGDLERLHYAAGSRTVDPTRSLYGPGSVTWRVNREAIILLGGGRALLLQVAHPLVAAGVAAYSDFRRNPLTRLWRTLDLVLTIVFASAAEAVHAVRQIERRHARVRGVLDEDVGPFARGTPYEANDAELLFWVHATLVDTALLVYERFVQPLTAPARATYYEESMIAARLFGIPEPMIPPTWSAFRTYMRRMLRGDTLSVGAAAREIAASILYPPLPPGVQHLFRATNLMTTGLLPPVIRRRYGLAWGPAQRIGLAALATVTQHTLAFLPDLARTLPHARRAAGSVAGDSSGLPPARKATRAATRRRRSTVRTRTQTAATVPV